MFKFKPKKIIDLTVPISENMPWEEDERPSFTVINDYKPPKHYKSHYMNIYLHTGTHVDAPSHFIENGRGIESLELSDLFGEAIVLDFTYLQPDEPIDLKALMAAEKQLKSNIKRHDLVLLKTLWSNRFLDTEMYWHHSPYVTGEAIEYLVFDKAIRAVGYDFIHEKYSKYAGRKIPKNILKDVTKKNINHWTILSNNLFQIEHLINLDKISEERCLIFVAPLPLVGMDGSPCRVIALE